MTSPNDANLYEIRETEQFDAGWRRAVRIGYINPMADPAAFAQIRELLAQDPYIMDHWPNVPANFRQIGLTPRVRLWYSIIEDDRTVWLESVSIVDED